MGWQSDCTGQGGVAGDPVQLGGVGGGTSTNQLGRLPADEPEPVLGTGTRCLKHLIIGDGGNDTDNKQEEDTLK